MRVGKFIYTPTKHDKEKGELILHLFASDKRGITRYFMIHGTRPRFYVNKEEFEKVKENAVKVLNKYGAEYKYEGFRGLNDDEEVVTIYVKYPFEVPVIREIFKKTYEANVLYSDAVRAFYGITPYIEVPNKVEINVEDIKPAEMPINPYKVHEIYFDIETTDAIMNLSKMRQYPKEGMTILRCVTCQHNNDYIEVAIMTDVDRHKVREMAKDVNYYIEKLQIKDDYDFNNFEPLDIPIYIDMFTPVHDEYPFPEELAEIEMYNWINRKIAAGMYLIGHNVNEFDIKILNDHAKKKNNEIRIWNSNHENKRKYYPMIDTKHCHVIDSMYLYKIYHYGEVTVKGRAGLNWIGVEELGYGKIKRQSIDEMFEETPEELILYNIWDCELIRRLFEHTHILENDIAECEYYNTTMENFGKNTKLVEASLRFENHSSKLVIPSHELGSIKIDIGGKVKEAPSGIFHGVMEADNTKEYPSVIINGNVDFRTMVKGDPEPGRPYSKFKHSGNMYYLDVPGIMPTKLKELADNRNKYRALLKEAKKQYKENPTKELKEKIRYYSTQEKYCKGAMNAWYGVLGSDNFALASGDIGTDITTTAREHLAWNMEHIDNYTLDCKSVEERVGFKLHEDKYTFETIYQDTDSCKFIINGWEDYRHNYTEEQQKKILEETTNLVCDYLNSTYDEMSMHLMGVPKNRAFHVKAEPVTKVYMQWGAKKRYVYIDFDAKGPEDIVAKGLEIVRSDTNLFYKQLLKEVYWMALNGEKANVIAKKIDSELRDLESGEYDMLLGKPTGYNSSGNNRAKFIDWSNENVDKNFILGDKMLLYCVKSVDGKIPPKDGHGRAWAALEYGDVPNDYGFELNYKAYYDMFIEMKTVKTLFGVFNTTYKDALNNLVMTKSEEWL